VDGDGIGDACDPIITGITAHGQHRVVLSPNPTDGPIRMVDLPVEAAKLVIYDLSGAVVYDGPAVHHVDLSHLAASVYRLRLIDRDGVPLFATPLVVF
jgi:hypothetical protein